jgi:predicted DNA-binding transcriptional regulator AlpA
VTSAVRLPKAKASDDKPTPPRLLPIDDACHELGKISRPRLYDLINGGELQSVMLGRRRFITSKSIDELIRRGSAPMRPQREA